MLSNWVGNADSIKQGLLACKQVGLAWTILDLQKPSHITDKQVCDVLDDMMQVGAHQGEHASDGFVAHGGDVEVLQVLKDAGYAEQIASAKWMLTQKAVKCMVSCVVMGETYRVFEVRSELPLADRTAFELVQELVGRGWEWRLWRPPSQRSRRAAPIPVGYKVGDAKVWYSTLEVHKHYCLALLNAEDRCSYCL